MSVIENVAPGANPLGHAGVFRSIPSSTARGRLCCSKPRRRPEARRPADVAMQRRQARWRSANSALSKSRALCLSPDPAAARRTSRGPRVARKKQAAKTAAREVQRRRVLVEHDMDFRHEPDRPVSRLRYQTRRALADIRNPAVLEAYLGRNDRCRWTSRSVRRLWSSRGGARCLTKVTKGALVTVIGANGAGKRPRAQRAGWVCSARRYDHLRDRPITTSFRSNSAWQQGLVSCRNARNCSLTYMLVEDNLLFGGISAPALSVTRSLEQVHAIQVIKGTSAQQLRPERSPAAKRQMLARDGLRPLMAHPTLLDALDERSLRPSRFWHRARINLPRFSPRTGARAAPHPVSLNRTHAPHCRSRIMLMSWNWRITTQGFASEIAQDSRLPKVIWPSPPAAHAQPVGITMSASGPARRWGQPQRKHRPDPAEGDRRQKVNGRRT